MFYKNWPYWLKGGILGVIISLILVPFFLSQAQNGGFMNFGFAAAMIGLAFLPEFLLYNFFSINTDRWSITQIIINGCMINVIFYFIIGAIIGLIYGKIKHKN